MSSSLILLLGIGCICMVVAMGSAVYLYMYNKPARSSGTGSKIGDVPIVLSDGQKLYLMSSTDKYIGSVYRKDDTANMCDAVAAKKPKRGAITLEKSGDQFLMKMDCDGDGSFTSYLTDVAGDILQPKKTTANKAWIATCTANACSFQSPKSKQYLGISGDTLSMTPSRVNWTVQM